MFGIFYIYLFWGLTGLKALTVGFGSGKWVKGGEQAGLYFGLNGLVQLGLVIRLGLHVIYRFSFKDQWCNFNKFRDQFCNLGKCNPRAIFDKLGFMKDHRSIMEINS